jgi:hypothetical protein
VTAVFSYVTWIRQSTGVSRIGYVSDTDTRSIRHGYISAEYRIFINFAKIRYAGLIRINVGDTRISLTGYGPAQLHRISRRPMPVAASHFSRIAPHPAIPPPARRDSSPASAACRPPATGDDPPIAGDKHPSLPAGDELRPCSPLRPASSAPPLLATSPRLRR